MRKIIYISIVILLVCSGFGCGIFKSRKSSVAKSAKKEGELSKKDIKTKDEVSDEVTELRKRLIELQKQVELLTMEGISLGVSGKSSTTILSEKALEEHRKEYEKLQQETSQIIDKIKKRLEIIDKQLEIINGMKEKIDTRIEELKKEKEAFLKLLEIKSGG